MRTTMTTLALVGLLAGTAQGQGTSGAAPAAGEPLVLTENKRIERLFGYGQYPAAWDTAQEWWNCFAFDQPYFTGAPDYFANQTDALWGTDLGFPTAVRGYPKHSDGRLYFFWGDSDALYRPWLDAWGKVAKHADVAPVISFATAFGETAYPLGTSNGDAISFATDITPGDGIAMTKLLRNVEPGHTQYPRAAFGMEDHAFRSTVVRLAEWKDSGPLYEHSPGVFWHRPAMGERFLGAVDVPGGILYLDNRAATDPTRRKEYLFNFRWYMPQEELLPPGNPHRWKARYRVNSFTTIAASDDLGLTWWACQQRKDRWPLPFSGHDPGAGSVLEADWANPVTGKFLNVAFQEVQRSDPGMSALPNDPRDPDAIAGDDRYVLIFGTGVGPDLNLHLACVPREQLITLAERNDHLGYTLKGVRYFAGLDAGGAPMWEAGEEQAVPVCWIKHPQIREEWEQHCINHSDPNVRVQVIEESISGAWTLSLQRIDVSFRGQGGPVKFDRLVAMVDLGYRVLTKNHKTHPVTGAPLATVSVAQLTAADHAAGHQAQAWPGPALFTASPSAPWAWNLASGATLDHTNYALPRPFRPLMLPKCANDLPILPDPPEHDIGDSLGSICSSRFYAGAPGGPHDSWRARFVDPGDTTKVGTELVGSPFILPGLAVGVDDAVGTKAGVRFYYLGVHSGYAVDLFEIKLTQPSW